MNPQDPAKDPEEPEQQDGLFGVGEAGAHSFLNQFLDNTPTVIYVTSLDDRFLFVNRAGKNSSACRCTSAGVSSGMYSRRPRRDASSRPTAASSRPAAHCSWKSASDCTPEGKHIPTRSRFPVRDGEGRIIAVGGSSIDVTERKWAEQAAGAAAARSLELLDASPDGIVVVRDLRMAYVNQAFCNLLGYAGPADLLGKSRVDVLAEPYRKLVAENALARVQGRDAPTRLCSGIPASRRPCRARRNSRSPDRIRRHPVFPGLYTRYNGASKIGQGAARERGPAAQLLRGDLRGASSFTTTA